MMRRLLAVLLSFSVVASLTVVPAGSAQAVSATQAIAAIGYPLATPREPIAVTPGSQPVATYSAEQTIPVPPASNYAGAGGGDGWDIALTHGYVYNVFHHLSQFVVACHRQSDASACYSPKTVRDGAGRAFSTSTLEGLWIDPDTDRLYAFGSRSDSVGGVVCFDTIAALGGADGFCGFTALTAAGEASYGGTASTLSQPAIVGNHMYAFNNASGQAATGAKNALVCFDLVAIAACADSPVALETGTATGVMNSSSWPTPQSVAIGGHVITMVHFSGGGDWLTCYDPSTAGKCAGTWPVRASVPTSSTYGWSLVPLLDAAGTEIGVCVATGVDPCYDLSGAPVATPAGMRSAITGDSGWNGSAVVLGPRIYVANHYDNSVHCYNALTDATCTGFPKRLNNLGTLYTVSQDPERPTCLWVNADNGSRQIQNFDAYTGGACSAGDIRVLASQFVVPTVQCQPATYASIQILDPAVTEYTSGVISFQDSDASAIPGEADATLDAAGAVDLSQRQLSTQVGLPQFVVHLEGLQGQLGAVTVKLTWTGADDPGCVNDGTTVIHPPTDHAPVANASGPYTVDEGSSVRLDGTASTDEDGDELRLEWDLDGDGATDSYAAQPWFDARWIDGPTTRSVSLTVCDPSEVCDTTTVEVDVLNVAPNVAPLAPRFAVIGQPFGVFAAWHDPADAADAPYGVQWSWLNSVHAVAGSSDVGALTVHDIGESTGSVTVTDDDSAQSQADSVVTGVREPLQCEAATVDTPVVWPANHKLVTVAISGPQQGDGSPVTVEAIYVHQDEVIDAHGDDREDDDRDGHKDDHDDDHKAGKGGRHGASSRFKAHAVDNVFWTKPGSGHEDKGGKDDGHDDGHDDVHDDGHDGHDGHDDDHDGDGNGDGHTAFDAVISDGVAQVRAERAGTGDGRVYTIGYRATAEDGRSCIGEVVVGVPHSAHSTAIRTDGVLIDSLTGATVEHTDAPSANLPRSLERSTAPGAAAVAEGGSVEFAVQVVNGQASDQIGILGTGPTLGSITSVGPLTCEVWGDGTTCAATVAYEAGSNGHGADDFSLAVVADGVAWEIPVSISVAAVNSAPALTVSPTSIEIAEDGGPTQVRLAARDAETAATDLTYSLAVAPEHGTLASGGVTVAAGEAIDLAEPLWFAPDPDFTGQDEFAVAVTDAGDGSAAPLATQVEVPVIVRDVADAPTFAPASVTVMEDQGTVQGFVVTDPDSATLAGTVSVAPSQGGADVEGVTCTAVGLGSECVVSVRYTPDANANGADSFTITATDGVLSTEFVVATTIYAVNDAPTLQPLARQVDFGGALDLARAELLAAADAGAANEQAQQLTFTVTSAVPEVSVVAGDETWTVKPADGTWGTFALDVQVCDDGTTVVVSDPKCAQSTLTLTVPQPHRAPTADAVTATAFEDATAVFDIVAHDADGDTLAFSTVGNVAHAAVGLSTPTCVIAAGASTCTVTATVTPEANYNGDIHFAVSASDGSLSVDIPVTVTVTAVNDAPTLQPLARQVESGGTLEVTRDELLAIADAGAPNEQAQQLTFMVMSADPDVLVTPGDGLWTIEPSAGSLGTFDLTLQVCDDGTTFVASDHKCAQSTLTLTVLPPNAAPTADAVSATTDEDATAVFDIQARDANGDALTFAVVGTVAHAAVDLAAPSCVSAAGASTCTVSASVVPDANFNGSVDFVVRVSDVSATVDIPVSVTVNAVNDAPTLTVPPTVTVAEDSSVDVAAVVADVDSPAASTTLTLVEVPAHGTLTAGGNALAVGDTIPGPAASLTYAPDFDYNGADAFVVAAVDGQGATSAPSTVAVTVTEVNDVPTVASQIAHVTAGGVVTLTAQDLLAGATAGPANESGQSLTIDSFTLQSGAPAHVTANGDGFDVVVDASASAQFVGNLRVCDDGTTAGAADPQCASATVNFTVGSARPDLSAPVIVLSDATVPEGSQAVVTVRTYDASGPVTVTATVDGAPVTVGSDGELRFTAPGPGYYAVVVTATDALGFSATASTSITVLGADDGVAPAVAISAPADGDTVTDATTVTGSVGDAALTHWRLTATAQGAFAADAIVIAEGDAAVTNGTLGTIDPTVLAAGQYVLRLEATDEGGRIGFIERPVLVGNVGKYGTFSMTFTDAVVPVAGIPLTVQRTYSSGARAHADDFGYGWSLSVNTLRLERDTVSGDQWVRENHGTFLPNYVLVPTSSHSVTVVDGAGKSIVFDFTPTFIDPITDGRYATASWTERTDTGAKLEPLDTKDLIFASGLLVSLDDALVYDPHAYRLTLADGRVLDFDLGEGLTRIQDAAGNVVTITANSIDSSTGESIALTRDADGRITSVSTPSGAATTYGYDQGGNLSSVTDAGGSLTSYAYDGGHYLTGIVDPLGRIPSRQEYDSDGRLVAVVDAAGNRTQINADPNTHTTTVTDRLGNTTVQQFDAAGYLVGQTFADGTSESYTVDADGNRLTRTDGAGATWTATYDGHDNRTSITDPLGNARSFTYDAKNRLTSATDALGNVTSLDYDSLGNVLAVHLPGGASTSYTYDAQGNTATETDESGRVTSHAYDAQGHLTSTTSPGGNVTTYTYDADGRLVSTTSPEGAVTGTTYDARGLATEVQNALGGATSSTFDAAGQRTATQSASGVNVTMTYDDLGRVASRTSASGTTTYAYDLEGRTVHVETPDGVVRETAYDSRGRVVEVRENGAVVSATTYDSAGRVATSTNALGDTATYAYDAAGRLTGTTRADGTTVSTTYDAAGQVLSVTSPSGTTTYTYDARGRVATAASSGSPTVTYTYDPAGRVLSQSSTDGTSMTFAYDADGRLASATDANGSAAAITYDGDGRRLTVDDANGHQRTWVYDDGGNLLSFDMEGVRQLTQAFDAASRVTLRAIGAQGATTYAYNADGRLAAVDAPDAVPVQYAYTASGLLASVTDARGVTSYTYDSRSRLSEVAAPEGSVGYTYDAASRVASVTTSAGVTSYERDALGRVTGVTDPAGGHYTLDRDTAGRVVSVGFPNGVSEAYTFDAAGRALTVTVTDSVGTVLGSFEVTRDEAGRIATFLDSFDTDTRSGSFDYDTGGRLTGATSTDGAASTASTFTLDAAGNRTAVTGDGAETASFNSLDQLVSDGDATYSYDASAFLTQITDGTGTTDLSYSSAGELLGVNSPAGAVSYGYDDSGVLVSRADGTGSVGLVNDASMSLPHAAAGSDGSWWVYAGSRALAQATADGQVHYLHEDPRGDVRLVTDVAGAVTDTFTYSVDGEVTARTGTTPVSVGWNGEYTDPATGMVWLRARWYDPASARFITADPWQGNPATPVSLNRYLYANADPINNTDPTGLETLASQNTAMALDGIVEASYGRAGLSLLRWIPRIAPQLFARFGLAGTTAILGGGTAVAVGGVGYGIYNALNPNDDGIDGPGTILDTGVDNGVDESPQTQTGGSGSNSGNNPPTITATTFCQGGTRIEPDDWNRHIYPLHVSGNPKKSTFYNSEDVEALICEALDGVPDAVGSANNGYTVRTYNAQRLIGEDVSTQSPTQFVTVVSRADGSVVTAHPGWPTPTNLPYGVGYGS